MADECSYFLVCRTWTLTSEPVMEPPRLLKECAVREGLVLDSFTVCGLGETTVA